MFRISIVKKKNADFIPEVGMKWKYDRKTYEIVKVMKTVIKYKQLGGPYSYPQSLRISDWRMYLRAGTYKAVTEPLTLQIA